MKLKKYHIEVLKMMDELKPFEEIKIVKGIGGKVDHYFITRTQKIVLREADEVEVN